MESIAKAILLTKVDLISKLHTPNVSLF